jgi:hypothetical protein
MPRPSPQRARHGLDARRLQGRHEAEQGGGDERRQAGEGQGVEIHLDLVEARQGVGGGRTQNVDDPTGQKETRAPPAAAIMRLSVRSCAASRRRPAPSAERIAISRSRAAARTSTR